MNITQMRNFDIVYIDMCASFGCFEQHRGDDKNVTKAIEEPGKCRESGSTPPENLEN